MLPSCPPLLVSAITHCVMAALLGSTMAGLARGQETQSEAPASVQSSSEAEDRALEATLATSLAAVRPACVSVLAEEEGGTFSAVLVSADGLLLTAGHCVTSDEILTVCMPDGRRFAAEQLGAEGKIDAGMLRIQDPPAGLPFVPLGRSADLKPGDAAFGIGFPGELHAGRGGVLRLGEILETNDESRHFLRSSVLMEPGDSGGPLFDIQGRLIGIHSQITDAVDDNFDVPIDLFKALWNDLLSGERGRFSKRMTDKIGIDGESTGNGIEVTSVDEDGLAYAAGLRAGDIIKQAMGTDVSSVRSIRRRLGRVWRQDILAAATLKVLRQENEASTESATQAAPTSIELVIHTDARQTFDTFTPPSTPTLTARELKAPVAPNAAAPNAAATSVVMIRSEIDGKSRTILGVIVSPDGLIVSKSSDIGDNVSIDHNGQHEATVISRSQDDDLVLLRCKALEDAPSESWVPFAKASAARVGNLTRSPLSTSGKSIRGVVGSTAFRMSSRTKFRLGVRLKTLEDGLEIEDVEPDSAAAEAKLQAGDVIVKIGDQPVTQIADLLVVLDALQKPTTLDLGIRRAAQDAESDEPREPLAVKITPQPREREEAPADMFAGRVSKRRSGFSLVFAHDSLLKPSQCGGPVLDLRGRVLGLNICRASRTQCLALPNVVVRDFVERNRPIR